VIIRLSNMTAPRERVAPGVGTPKWTDGPADISISGVTLGVAEGGEHVQLHSQYIDRVREGVREEGSEGRREGLREP